ncbi:MAG: hypothetical protein PHQ86_06845 [Dehalococcoidales bacterium]|nr:hypothetical protein [Dehalococcoidales bacterium]
MITIPTRIVLGAGASASYDYPLGNRLLKIIDLKLARPNGNWIPILKKCGINTDEIEKFRYGLFHAQPFSVGSFLESRPEFITIGKLVIALSLIPYEKHDGLFSFDARENGCYQYIFNRMISGCPFADFRKNEIAFITFNYDRSLEYYLHTALTEKYGETAEETAAVLNKIPIIHVHGSLGKLTWQISGIDEFSRPYRPRNESNNDKEIQSAAEQIIIISEGKDTSAEFQEASNLLKSGERIYFLGFGYNDTNLRRLKIDELPPVLRKLGNNLNAPHMRGSAKGLYEAEREQIQLKW